MQLFLKRQEMMNRENIAKMMEDVYLENLIIENIFCLVLICIFNLLIIWINKCLIVDIIIGEIIYAVD